MKSKIADRVADKFLDQLTTTNDDGGWGELFWNSDTFKGVREGAQQPMRMQLFLGASAFQDYQGLRPFTHITVYPDGRVVADALPRTQVFGL